MTAPARPHISIAAASRAIVTVPAPVLMIDTCTLLDVARAPLRGLSATIVPTIDLVQLTMRTPKRVHVVLSYTVEEEWERYIEQTVGEMRKQIRAVRESLLALRTACRPLGIPLPSELGAQTDPLADRLHDLARQLHASGLVLARDPTCYIQAAARSNLGDPPAKPGKSSAGDCQIVEHFLALCRTLRSEGFAAPCVFVSSNTEDYCEGRHGLHRKLEAEFQPFTLSYARNLGEARRLLGV